MGNPEQEKNRNLDIAADIQEPGWMRLGEHKTTLDVVVDGAATVNFLYPP